jgi:hypothetical protein
LFAIHFVFLALVFERALEKRNRWERS